MSLHLLGNLLGRLVVSYALVWLFMWIIIARLNWRRAFHNTNRWYGLLSVIVIFLTGVFIAAAKGALLQ